MAEVIYKIKGDNSGFQKTVNETEQVAAGGFNKIKLGAVAAWAAVGAAVIKAGKIIGQTIGEAVNQYAEYEQLIAGSELMFGEGFQFISDKAKEAYSTVGLSQNEYLQQVNGFAVGLREALGGNEQAAAELADKIVTAEADIVAATGNTQENVQNAFNGIMKGNYTMLDNLQLGIKPTKEGFQEVIDKVNAWHESMGDATRYTIDNLADCEAAIVDYVEMQGLAGYAANELGDTIQGAANQAKAAWKNLLTGLGDADADIEELVGNLMDSIGVLIENLLPVIGRILEALWAALVEAGSRLAEIAGEWMTQMGEAMKEKASEVWDSILEFFAEKFEAIREFFAEIWEGIRDFFVGIWDSIKQVFVDVWNSLSEENQAWLLGIWETIQERWNAICEFFKSIWDAIKSVVSAAVEGISSFLSGAWNTIKSVIEAVWNAISGFFKSIWDAIKNTFSSGVDNAKSIFEGFKNTISQIWENIKGIFDGFITFFRGVFTGNWKAAWEGICNVVRNMVGIFKTLGSNLMEGLKNGILERARHIVDAVRGAVQNAISAAKNLLGIASPSKVFRHIGVFIDQGLADGIDEEADKPKTAIEAVAKQVIAAANEMRDQMTIAFDDMASAFSNLLNTIGTSGDVEYDPEVDYSALMDEAKDTEEFLSLAAKRNAKIMGENINLVEKGWRDNSSIMNTWLTKTTQDINKIRSVLTDALEDVSKYTSDSANKIVDTASDKMVELKDNADQMKKDMTDSLSTMPSDFYNIGMDTVNGLINGLQSRSSALYDAVRSIAAQTVATMKSELEISSPSKVFAKLGRFVDAGFAEGIEGNSRSVLGAALSMVRGAISGAMNGMQTAYATYNSSSTNNSFSVAKISDTIHIRSEADIEALLEAIYNRFMSEKRGRGLF